MQLVWFKRDLRVEDNLALTLAAKDIAVIPLYILEPELWIQDDLSYRQYLFLQDSLKSLDENLQMLDIGGMNRLDKLISLPLHHGDILVWGRSLRLAYHSLSTLKLGVHPILGKQRINLTFRRVSIGL